MPWFSKGLLTGKKGDLERFSKSREERDLAHYYGEGYGDGHDNKDLLGSATGKKNEKNSLYLTVGKKP